MQCSARAKSTGQPCRRSAIDGGRVCQVHGGAAPQVKAKAQERIAELVAPALARIEKLIGKLEADGLSGGAENENVALAAARDILDRAGYSATHRLEMSGEMTVVSPVDLELEELGKQIRLSAEHPDLDEETAAADEQIAARPERARESVEDISQ